jgi:probable F420-dependent oxidoreductase
MQLGIFGINSGSTFRPADTIAIARLAEELGFDSVWAGEHVVVPSPRVAPSPMEPEDPILDPLVHLAFVAAATERLLLGTGIIILPQRNPLVLAKQAATLDVLSNGRLLLGIGAGYLEPEMTAIGVPMAGRGDRTDDHLAAMRAIWTHPGPVAHHGPFIDFAGVDAHPRPVTPGGPKIVVGGHTPAAYRRAVTKGNGWYGFGLTPEQTVASGEGLRRAADEVERPPQLGELELSVTPRRRVDAEALEAFTAAGIDRLVLSTFSDASPADVERRLRDAAELVGSTSG